MYLYRTFFNPTSNLTMMMKNNSMQSPIRAAVTRGPCGKGFGQCGTSESVSTISNFSDLSLVNRTRAQEENEKDEQKGAMQAAPLHTHGP